MTRMKQMWQRMLFGKNTEQWDQWGTKTFCTRYKGHSGFLPLANEVWGKVIFSQASVILFTGRGHAWHALYRHACTPWACTPPRGYSICGYYEMRSLSRQYASYWNAFLFFLQFDPYHKCTRSVSGSFQFPNNCTVHVKLFTNEKVGKNLIFKNS